MTQYDQTVLRSAISTATGEPEVSAAWAAEHRDAFRLVDIREPHELVGPLGHIDGVENIPLLQLLSQASRLDCDEPLLLICRSGRRSGRLAKTLRDSGIACVASVEGGMIAWNLDVWGKGDILHDEKVANTHNLSKAIYRTNGLPEVSAQWVQKNLGRFRLIDVREPHELVAHGRVAQSENIPLGSFMETAQGLDRDAPMVVMCASGGRSGRVAIALESAGFRNVASMEGGIFGWKAYGLPSA